MRSLTRSFRCTPATTTPLPRRPNQPPAWATAPTEAFPPVNARRTGFAVPVRQWRADGRRRNGGRP